MRGRGRRAGRAQRPCSTPRPPARPADRRVPGSGPRARRSPDGNSRQRPLPGPARFRPAFRRRSGRRSAPSRQPRSASIRSWNSTSCSNSARRAGSRRMAGHRAVPVIRLARRRRSTELLLPVQIEDQPLHQAGRVAPDLVVSQRQVLEADQQHRQPLGPADHLEVRARGRLRPARSAAAVRRSPPRSRRLARRTVPINRSSSRRTMGLRRECGRSDHRDRRQLAAGPGQPDYPFVERRRLAGPRCTLDHERAGDQDLACMPLGSGGADLTGIRPPVKTS